MMQDEKGASPSGCSFFYLGWFSRRVLDTATEDTFPLVERTYQDDPEILVGRTAEPS